MRWMGVAAAVFALAIVWAGFDRANSGAPGFYVWKTLSGQGHGGRRANIDGVSIYYETFGKGPPVLILHGGKGVQESMRYQIAALAIDHLVIAPDSRGHGRSTDGPGPLHYADMADDMVGLLDTLHIARADVVGWSDGGIIALDLAMRYPGRIGRVVTMGANFDASGLVDPVAPPAPVSPPAAGQADVDHRPSAISPEAMLSAKVDTMWATEPHYSPADLRQIHSPVLVIAGERDVIRRDHTDALARAIPGAGELIIPGANHDAPQEVHDAVNAAIRAFLTGGR